MSIKQHKPIGLPKEPEDLDIKIGTPNEVFWTDFKKKIEDDVLAAKRSIEIADHLMVLAKAKIKQEKTNI